MLKLLGIYVTVKLIQCYLCRSQWDSHKAPGFHPKYLCVPKTNKAFMCLETHGGGLGQSDVCGEAPLNTKIILGDNAAAGSWPWQASINKQSSGSFICSGTLINKEWVLTAADCVLNISASNIVIYLGRLNQNGSNPYEISTTVTKIIIHPKYASIDSKLALLQLSSSVNLTDYIRPVCLAPASSGFVAGTESWVTGWGTLSVSEIKFSDTLQEVGAPIVTNNECENAFGEVFTDSLMCAGFFNEEANPPCVGDAGSPLVTRQDSVWIQSGVLIFSFKCGLPGVPAAYIRVSEHLDWINNYTHSSEPELIPYPIDYVIDYVIGYVNDSVNDSVFDGGSSTLLSFPLALMYSIIPLILIFF